MPENYIEQRPWGRFEILSQFEVISQSGRDVCVKKHTLKPGGSFSYQSHKQRAEFWVVVQGQGKLVLNDAEKQVGAGDVIQIPLGARHRMINTGNDADLIIIEVTTGHFDENDIERYSDDYGRVGAN